mmetsp:Transcript_10962/g.20144  ORF Transcript_10962/g.20144 Transcript_10962/m.20144 type:complete len:229 (-) Transcript_10962:75-761(-)
MSARGNMSLDCSRLLLHHLPLLRCCHDVSRMGLSVCMVGCLGCADLCCVSYVDTSMHHRRLVAHGYHPLSRHLGMSHTRIHLLLLWHTLPHRHNAVARMSILWGVRRCSHCDLSRGTVDDDRRLGIVIILWRGLVLAGVVVGDLDPPLPLCGGGLDHLLHHGNRLRKEVGRTKHLHGRGVKLHLHLPPRCLAVFVVGKVRSHSGGYPGHPVLDGRRLKLVEEGVGRRL